MNSTNIASNAAGIAPFKIITVLLRVKPVTLNSPNPPAPIKAAYVAVPMEITAAVFIPAKTVGADNGIST